MSRITLLALVALLATGSASDPVTGPAGVYTVTTSGPTRVTSGEGWVKIEWEIEKVPPPPEPSKPPDPNPVVTPPPPPTPAVSIPTLTGRFWLLAVYDKDALAHYPPGQQALLASKTIRPALEDIDKSAVQDISWQPRDKHDPTLKTWLDDATATGLPAIVVIGNAGNTSFAVPLPADEAGVVALAKKIRGQ